jgi:hypothetical protein
MNAAPERGKPKPVENPLSLAELVRLAGAEKLVRL